MRDTCIHSHNAPHSVTVSSGDVPLHIANETPKTFI